MYNSVKHCIGDSLVTDGIIPVFHRELRGHDNRLPVMAVFDDFQQDGTFLGIQRYKEGIIEDKQLTPLYLLQLRLYGVLGLCDLQRAEQL